MTTTNNEQQQQFAIPTKIQSVDLFEFLEKRVPDEQSSFSAYIFLTNFLKNKGFILNEETKIKELEAGQNILKIVRPDGKRDIFGVLRVSINNPLVKGDGWTLRYVADEVENVIYARIDEGCGCKKNQETEEPTDAELENLKKLLEAKDTVADPVSETLETEETKSLETTSELLENKQLEGEEGV